MAIRSSPGITTLALATPAPPALVHSTTMSSTVIESLVSTGIRQGECRAADGSDSPSGPATGPGAGGETAGACGLRVSFGTSSSRRHDCRPVRSVPRDWVDGWPRNYTPSGAGQQQCHRGGEQRSPRWWLCPGPGTWHCTPRLQSPTPLSPLTRRGHGRASCPLDVVNGSAANEPLPISTVPWRRAYRTAVMATRGGGSRRHA